MDRLSPCLLVAGLLTGCAMEVTNRDSRGTEIICFGDSLTAGLGAAAGNDYPSRLSTSLGRPVVNAGVSGDTTADALARLERDVLSRNPRLVVVAFGGNDFIRRVPPADTFRNLDEIVRRIQEKGAMVVVAGVRSGLLGNALKKDFKKLARARRAAFVPDLLEDIWGHPALMSDGIHPNEAGYAVMAGRVEKTVAPLLEPS